MAIGTAMAVGGAALKAGTAIDSAIQARRLQRSLEKLQKQPIEKFTVSPQVENLYRQAVGEASTPEGFGGATTSAFRQNLARLNRGRFGQALNMSGGSGARGINAVLNNQGMDAINQFALNNENLTRSNRLGALGRAGTYASQFQNIRDRNTSFAQNYRLMLERALGEGIRGNRDYVRSMASGLGSDLMMSGIGYLDGFQGGGGDESYTPTNLRYTDPMLLRPRPTSFDTLTNDTPVTINRGRQNRFMYGG